MSNGGVVVVIFVWSIFEVSTISLLLAFAHPGPSSQVYGEDHRPVFAGMDTNLALDMPCRS